MADRRVTEQPSVPMNARGAETGVTGATGNTATARQFLRTSQALMLPLALVAAFAIFSIARPETFFSLTNVETMLRQMAPQAIAAFGLTAVLVMGDFDLSL